MNKQKGNFFLLPNKIFEEGLTPMEFTVYGFLQAEATPKGRVFIQCRTFPKPAVCVRTPAVRQSKDLQKKAMLMFRKDTLITQGRVIFTQCSNYEPPPVQQTVTNN